MATVQGLIPLDILHPQVPWSSRWRYTGSWGRGFAPLAGPPFSRTVCCAWPRAPRRRLDARGPLPTGKENLEKLWEQFFAVPSEWWDCRPEKVDPHYPDFKHKKTQSALWTIHKSNPPWVEAKLAAIAPGTLKCNMFTWNVRIQKSVKAGNYTKAMELFQQMQREGLHPNQFTSVAVLKACSGLQDLEEGRRIHTQIVQAGHESDVYVGNCLLDMYCKCGSIEDARTVFDEMSTRDVVAWSAMILGYVKCGKGKAALRLYRQMQLEGVEPDPVTFVGLLNACASVGALDEGKRVHEQIMERFDGYDVFVGSSLVDMYAKCGSIEDARAVFNKIYSKDVVAWSTMIMGYVKCGNGQEALDLSRQMQQEGVMPNSVTFVGILNACGIVEALEEGRNIHKQILKRGYVNNVFVNNSLVYMYVKCGSMGDARRVFNKMPTRDVVVWSAMILGYVKSEHGQEALELFQQMQREGVDPNRATFMGVLNACASLVALEEGQRVHEQIIDRGYQGDLSVGNSLVDMYAKCGRIEDARRVFDKMPRRDTVTWNTMLLGYEKQGYAKEALKHLERMCQQDIEIVR